MAQTGRVVILGGHGKVAQIATAKLIHAGFVVDAVIRDAAQSDDIKGLGAQPVVLDMEAASVDDFVEQFSGAAAIVFAAGAGGGNPKRARAVDYEAATRTVMAAGNAEVKRFVMLSYYHADTYIQRVKPDEKFYPYAKAKHDADAFLRNSQLDYTILGPGLLTNEDETGRVIIDSDHDQSLTWKDRPASRANVAGVIARVVESGAAVRQTLNFGDGNERIVEIVS